MVEEDSALIYEPVPQPAKTSQSPETDRPAQWHTLNKIKKILDPDMENENHGWVNNLINDLAEKGVSITVETNDRPIHYKASPDADVTLYIRSPQEFTQKTLDIAHNPNNKWGDSTRQSIWFNATANDFLEPTRYLDRISYHIKDTTFDWLNHYQNMGQVSGIQENLFVQHHQSRSDMESNDEIRVALSSAEPNSTDEIHTVRYARISGSQAIIYAVQMPDINGGTERTATAKLNQAKEGLQEFKNHFLHLYHNQKDAYTQKLGDIPTDILETEDPTKFAIKYFKYLQKKAQKDGEKDMWTWVFNKKIPEIPEENSNRDLANIRLLHYDIEYLERWVNTLTNSNILSALEQFPQRKERMKRFNRRETRGLSSQSPAAVLSLATTAHMLHSQGVREILIPEDLPLREHDGNWQFFNPGSEDLDKKIKLSKIENAIALTKVADGATVDNENDDGYIHIILGDKLAANPNYPILNQIFKNLENNNL